MPRWQVWEYGYGDAGRLHFDAPHEEGAARAFLDRRVASGVTFREALRRRGQDRVLVAVKDPSVTGTRESPNYPSVHAVDLVEDPSEEE